MPAETIKRFKNCVRHIFFFHVLKYFAIMVSLFIITTISSFIIEFFSFDEKAVHFITFTSGMIYGIIVATVIKLWEEMEHN